MKSPRYVNYEGVVFCVSLNEFAKILLGGLPVQPTQNFIYTTFKSIAKYFRLVVLRSNLGSNLAKLQILPTETRILKMPNFKNGTKFI
jgi:hypothetical protein